MAQSCFHFKQFAVDQRDCAMKVTRDACLLGAWAAVSGCRHLLDIGTGTGLLALMCAQRSSAQIDALELDAAAAARARDNCRQSPWSARIQVHHQSLQQWLEQLRRPRYDGIICNPPFFVDSLRCPDPQRNQARHTDTLDFATLSHCIDQLLTQDGHAWLLLPTDHLQQFMTHLPTGLYPEALCTLAHSAQHRPKRALLTLSRDRAPCTTDHLALFDSEGQYTDAARTLMAPYYLKLP